MLRVTASSSCTDGFYNTLDHCGLISNQTAATQQDAAEVCAANTGTLGDFTTLEQFTFTRLMMSARQLPDSVYIGFRRDGDHFVDGGGRPLVRTVQTFLLQTTSDI